MLCGERSLRYVLKAYVAPFHDERPHQGTGHVIRLPSPRPDQGHEGPTHGHERLGGLRKDYDRETA